MAPRYSIVLPTITQKIKNVFLRITKVNKQTLFDFRAKYIKNPLGATL